MSTDCNTPYEPPKIFERFSDDIRDAMKLANREAKRRFAPSIETFHLMTAIAQEPTGLGGVLLRQYGITGRVVRKLSRHIRIGSKWVTIWGKLPLSSNTKQLIESAINFALIKNHKSVGTGGVLLGMLTIDETTTTLLRSTGIDLHKFEEELGQSLNRLMAKSPDQEMYPDALDSTDL